MGIIPELSQTPIIPIHIGDDDLCFALWKVLERKEFYYASYLSGCPQGQALVRTSYSANHTDEELHQVLAAFEKSAGLGADPLKSFLKFNLVKKVLLICYVQSF